MALTMRPTGLGSGAYQDNVDYNVFSGEWLIGRIYERNGFPDEVRFFWSLHGVGVATWSVAAYVAICFVAPMRPLLERLLLTYAVGAIFTLLMQTYARFDQCVGIVACTFSFGKGVVWSTIWPVAWIIGRGAS